MDNDQTPKTSAFDYSEVERRILDRYIETSPAAKAAYDKAIKGRRGKRKAYLAAFTVMVDEDAAAPVIDGLRTVNFTFRDHPTIPGMRQMEGKAQIDGLAQALAEPRDALEGGMGALKESVLDATEAVRGYNSAELKAWALSWADVPEPHVPEPHVPELKAQLKAWAEPTTYRRLHPDLSPNIKVGTLKHNGAFHSRVFGKRLSMEDFDAVATDKEESIALCRANFREAWDKARQAKRDMAELDKELKVSMDFDGVCEAEVTIDDVNYYGSGDTARAAGYDLGQNVQRALA